MCMVSNVYDQWNPWIPSPNTAPFVPHVSPPFPNIQPTITVQGGVTITPEDLRVLLENFHKAVEAAKEFDRLTKQPDCEDPEKAKLEKRVAELEERLDALEEEL